jgi:hypothetical protein
MKEKKKKKKDKLQMMKNENIATIMLDSLGQSL